MTNPIHAGPARNAPNSNAPNSNARISSGSFSLGQWELESEVTAALTRATDVDSDKVTVSAQHGVVTLSGDVDGAGDRSAPQAVAHLVPGVTAVRNELAVLHARSAAAVPPTRSGTTT